MTATPLPPPETADLPPTWWGRHRDLVVYPAILLVVTALGLVWNGALSLVLTPVWMLLGAWLIPAAIARLATAVRARR